MLLGTRPRPRPIADVLYGLASVLVRRRPRDLSLTAAATLANLERTGPRRITDLAAAEGVTQPSMTAVVAQLERLGYATRRRDPDDGRAVRAGITPAGIAYLEAGRRAAAERLEGLLGGLTGPESSALADALPALRRLLELAEQAAPPSRVASAGDGRTR